MAWLAVAAMATLSFGSTYYAQKSQQLQQKAETAEMESQMKSQYSAINQAQLDKQRETDMTVYQQDREARRAESMARANQANAGIAGVTAHRQIDNVLFQSVLDENFIKTQGENELVAIRNEGWDRVSGMQSQINLSKNRTASNKQIMVSSFLSGASAGLSTYGASSKGSSSSSSGGGSSGGGGGSSGG